MEIRGPEEKHGPLSHTRIARRGVPLLIVTLPCGFWSAAVDFYIRFLAEQWNREMTFKSMTQPSFWRGVAGHKRAFCSKRIAMIITAYGARAFEFAQSVDAASNFALFLGLATSSCTFRCTQDSSRGKSAAGQRKSRKSVARGTRWVELNSKPAREFWRMKKRRASIEAE
jgi:hypothetical protein